MRMQVYEALRQCTSNANNVIEEASDSELLDQFYKRRDEASFGGLVQRHGPMVQGVCRRILGDVHDAEDAFQAVFLVLARKCGSIRKPELLGNWLYGVACRVARKARSKALRKETWERRAGKMATQEQILDLEWVELKQVLDDELSRLPEKYRAPLVLCYLQGRTNSEAAAQLGWPAGSISGRLARAREILRKRLNRRGLTLSAGLLAVLLSQKAAAAQVSPLLVEAAIRAGLSSTAKGTGAVSSSVRELASEGSRATWTGQLKTLALAFVIALVVAVLWPTRGLSNWSLSAMLKGAAWNANASIAAFPGGTSSGPGTTSATAPASSGCGAH